MDVIDEDEESFTDEEESVPSIHSLIDIEEGEQWRLQKSSVSLLQLEKTWISDSKLEEISELSEDELEEEEEKEKEKPGEKVSRDSSDWLFEQFGIDQDQTSMEIPESLKTTPSSSLEDVKYPKEREHFEVTILDEVEEAEAPRMSREEALTFIRAARSEREKLKLKNAFLQVLVIRALEKLHPHVKDLMALPGTCKRDDNNSLSFDFTPSPTLMSRSSMIESRKSAITEQAATVVQDVATRCRKYAERLRLYAEERKDDIERRQEMKEKLSLLREAKGKNGAICEELMQQFNARLKEVGTGLKSSRTGNIMPDKFLFRLLDRQMRSWKNLANERVNYIKARDRTKEMEAKVANREIIAGDLTVSLYETMTLAKISYMDKTEERDEELSRMRDKCRSDMVMAAHVREKAAAVATDTETAKAELKELKDKFQKLRGQVARLRHKRGATRLEIEHTKDSHGLLLKPAHLLQDYTDSVAKVEEMKIKLEKLKSEYAHFRLQLLEIRSMQMHRTSKSTTRIQSAPKSEPMLPSIHHSPIRR